MEAHHRIDKWLWAVRIFKSRKLATEACRSNKILVNGQIVKPSREVQLNDLITIYIGPIAKTIKVKEFLANRVSAKLVHNYLVDLTPLGELKKMKIAREINYESRPRGLGRPTKKERRMIEKLKKSKF